jgi:O-antigen/teichoic acid export membrane protein
MGEGPKEPHSTEPTSLDTAATANEPGALRSRIVSGAGWKSVTLSVSVFSRLVVMLILARLLTPQDFGLAAMALVFSGLGFLLADSPFGLALVQRRQISESDRSTAFWVAAAVGLVLTIVGVASSGAIASIYGEPDVQPLFVALSLTFFVSALGATHGALLTRALDFRSLELRMLAGNLIGAAVAIAAAVAGAGAWAIILQQVAVSVVSTVLLWTFSAWRPRLTLSRASLGNMSGFGGNILGERLLFYSERNADNFLVGRFLGSAALGAYTVAYNLMLFPVERIAAPIRQILFPAFARMQDDRERLASAWLRVSRLLAAICAPAAVGAIIVAPDFVPAVLGDRWSDAIPVLQILAPVGLLQSIEALNGSLLLARDRSRTVLRFSIGAFAISLIGFSVGIAWGIVGVAIGYAVAATVSWLTLSWLTARVVDSSLKELWRSLVGVLQASLILAAILLAARVALVEAAVPAGIRLAVLVALGVVIYIPCCAWRAGEVLIELKGLRSRQRMGTTRKPATTLGGS